MNAPTLRVVTPADVERAAEEHLLREAVRLAKAVLDAQRDDRPVFPTARASRLVSAATAYLDVVRNGEPT